MKNYILIIFSIITIEIPALTAENDRYLAYSQIAKNVSELEWRLVQVNLKLGASGYYVYFNQEKSTFNSDKFVNTHDLSTAATPAQRERLMSECNFVAAVIGSEFLEFKTSGANDLEVKYIIGESSSRTFATYSMGIFTFTKEYYDFKNEYDK